MPVIRSSRIVELAQSTNIKKTLIEAIDISEVDVTGQNLLIATYFRPEKTGGGVIRPEENIREDEYQSNTGLVLKVGDGFDEREAATMLHQWVVFGHNAGLRFHYDGIPCRILDAGLIRMVVKDPSKVI